MIKVLLADDNHWVRLAVRTEFAKHPDLELIGEEADYAAVVDQAITLQPDLILLGIHDHDEQVLSGIPQMVTVCPKLVILTACTDPEMHIKALRLGAMSLVTEHQPIEILVKAIRACDSGELWVSRASVWPVTPTLESVAAVDLHLINPNLAKLTPRELEVARLAASGLPAKKIASKLVLSDKTIRNQLVVIYDKLEIKNQIELVMKGVELGLIIVKSA